MTLNDLISLKGLITVSAILSITVKYLKVTLKVNEKNVNVNGNNNRVSVVYNDALSMTQRNFSLLWNLLTIFVFFTYPFFGAKYNFLLKVLTCVGVPIALYALLVHCVRYGVGRRVWQLFYVIGTAIACLLAWGGMSFLEYTANQAVPVYTNLFATFNLLSKGANLSSIAPFFIRYVGWPLVSMMGFSLFFLSVIYLIFAFIKERDFNESLKFSISHIGISVIGYILACNVFLAIFFQNFQYVKSVFVSPFLPLLPFLPFLN